MEASDAADTSVADALSVFSAALTRLVVAVEDGVDRLDDDELIELVHGFERVRCRLPLVDHRLVREAEERDLAAVHCQGRLTRLLTTMLQISPAEAHRRVRAAEQLGGRLTQLGEELSPLRPVLASAQRQGSVTPDQVDIILRGLTSVDVVGADDADLSDGERMLTGLAATLGPKDLQTCTHRFLDHLVPDGSRPQEAVNAERRLVELRPRRDGSWRGELRLTGPLGSKLRALLDPLARPRVSTLTGPQGRLVEAPDERSHGQRLHDALEDLCDRLLRSGGVTESGGVPATVVVTIDHESLLSQLGHGTASDGTRLSARQVLQLAGEAEIIPTVLNRCGAVLAAGRSRRLASRAQTLALVARDGGCSFPGCAHPPEWCERHHIRAWMDGGMTDLDNLTLLCRYHHHNFAARGWACRLNRDRLPEWIPPSYVDSGQTPLTNHRILAAHGHYTTAA